MTDIHDLNISDIREFLLSNNIRYKNKDIYDIALNLMKKQDTKYDDVNISIIQWMLAYNALQKKLDIQSYTESQIKNLSQNDLNNLVKSLGLTKNNIDNVINVLRFMHKLKESELDFETYDDLYINLLRVSNFETILKLLKSKPSLKYQIPVLFYDILIYNKGIDNFHNQTSNFVRGLIDLRYFDIIEKILPIISEDDYRNYFNLIELFTEKRYLDKYFKYFPNQYHPILIKIITKALYYTHYKNIPSYYLIYKILEFGINNNNLDMIKGILDNLRINKFKYENKFNGTFHLMNLEFNDDEKDNLDILISEAKELMRNL